MNIMLPIVLAALALGLLAPRMTPRLWAGLTAWILLVVLYNFFKS